MYPAIMVTQLPSPDSKRNQIGYEIKHERIDGTAGFAVYPAAKPHKVHGRAEQDVKISTLIPHCPNPTSCVAGIIMIERDGKQNDPFLPPLFSSS